MEDVLKNREAELVGALSAAQDRLQQAHNKVHQLNGALMECRFLMGLLADPVVTEEGDAAEKATE